MGEHVASSALLLSTHHPLCLGDVLLTTQQAEVSLGHSGVKHPSPLS